MAGAILSEDLTKIIEQAGFTDYKIYLSPVTDEYANKWGHGLEIKNYIGQGVIRGTK